SRLAARGQRQGWGRLAPGRWDEGGERGSTWTWQLCQGYAIRPGACRAGGRYCRQAPGDEGDALRIARWSDRMQVPVVFQIGNGVFELLQLTFLARHEHIDVVRADVAGQDLAVVQGAQRVAQVVGQARLELLVGIALDGVARLYP